MRKLTQLLDLTAAELSIVVTSDTGIRGLNREYRGKDAATDVLSFPQMAEAASGLKEYGRGGAGAATRPPLPLGDIVMSLETAQRQAAASRLPAAARLRTLLIHGLAHLLGYDHERSRAEARRQFALERELAARLGGVALADSTNAIAAGRESPPSSPATGRGRRGGATWLRPQLSFPRPVF